MLTVAAVVFDVKDVEGDRAEGIRTIPNVYGPHRTRVLAQLLTLAAAATVVGAFLLVDLPTTVLVLLGFNLYVSCYIPFATPDRGPLFYGFVVDGEHLFLAILVVVVNRFVA